MGVRGAHGRNSFRDRGSHSAVHGLDGLVDGVSLSRRSRGVMLARIKRCIPCVFAFVLAACSENPADPSAQIGPNPNLPEPKLSLFPKIRTASVLPWKKGE